MPLAPVPSFGLLHEIFVIDAHLQESLDQTKHESITNKLIDDLMSTLRMFKLGDLQIYEATDLRAPGWSFIQPITTSHISGHYFEKPGRLPHIRMDIYSCCEVKWKQIIPVLDKHLKLENWSATFIDRQIDQPRRYMEVSGNGTDILEQSALATHAKSQILV